VANLFDNAIKYTPAGGTIRVTLAGHGSSLRLSIADNGPGIAADQRERVLQPFVRLAMDDRQAPGTGLGLSVVAAIAEAHGACLRLNDAEPGLEVTLDFPLREHGQRINSQ